MRAVIRYGGRERHYIFEKVNGEKLLIYFTNSWKPSVKKEDQERFFGDIDEVIGNTFKVKEYLKSLGYHWDPFKKAWVKRDIKQLWEKKKKEEEVERWKDLVDTAKDIGLSFEETWEEFTARRLSKEEARKIWEEGL